MYFGHDNRFDIRVNKALWNFKFFSEYIQHSVASDKSDENDITIWDAIKNRQFGIASQLDWLKASFFDYL